MRRTPPRAHLQQVCTSFSNYPVHCAADQSPLSPPKFAKGSDKKITRPLVVLRLSRPECIPPHSPAPCCQQPCSVPAPELTLTQEFTFPAGKAFSNSLSSHMHTPRFRVIAPLLNILLSSPSSASSGITHGCVLGTFCCIHPLLSFPKQLLSSSSCRRQQKA